MANKADAPLDDLMMAMDVVDTLRHDEALVMKELASDDRDARMIERLREVYTSQGIEVTDDILKAGVEGLKEDRFVYMPPATGFSRWLALAYVTRMTWAKWLAISLFALVLVMAAWQFLVVGPRERAAAAQHTELTQTLPAELKTLSERIKGMTRDTDALAKAQRLTSDGVAALTDENLQQARKAVTDLKDLSKELALVFEVRIVSRPGTPTGVTRIPDVNRRAKNYYLVVEAIGADGKPLSRGIRSEEDNKTRDVTIWAQRVSRDMFNRIRQDKAQDGIVQNSLLGKKLRGKADISWVGGVQQGAITEW